MLCLPSNVGNTLAPHGLTKVAVIAVKTEHGGASACLTNRLRVPGSGPSLQELNVWTVEFNPSGNVTPTTHDEAADAASKLFSRATLCTKSLVRKKRLANLPASRPECSLRPCSRV
jgi:hypothetical protein